MHTEALAAPKLRQKSLSPLTCQAPGPSPSGGRGGLHKPLQVPCSEAGTGRGFNISHRSRSHCSKTSRIARTPSRPKLPQPLPSHCLKPSRNGSLGIKAWKVDTDHILRCRHLRRRSFLHGSLNFQKTSLKALRFLPYPECKTRESSLSW